MELEYLVWCPEDRSVDIVQFAQLLRHKVTKGNEVLRSQKSRLVASDHQVQCEDEFWAKFPSFSRPYEVIALHATYACIIVYIYRESAFIIPL